MVVRLDLRIGKLGFNWLNWGHEVFVLRGGYCTPRIFQRLGLGYGCFLVVVLGPFSLDSGGTRLRKVAVEVEKGLQGKMMLRELDFEGGWCY